MALVRCGIEKHLFVAPPSPDFKGRPFRGGLLCPLIWQNAEALMSWLPELRPRRAPSAPSFGFGDRLGLATPGHVRALGNAKVFPVFAQQSVRENARTGRTFADVLTDAVFGVLQGGWTLGFGSDADHLKSVDEARNAARLGYTFFTCDPSDFLVPVESLSKKELSCKVKKLSTAGIVKKYAGRSFSVPDLGKLEFKKEDIVRIAVKYERVLSFAEEMYHALEKEIPQGFDFELSVDETLAPTTEKEHLFVALELKERGVKLTSLAPHFPGAMEKAIDYRGDLWEFRQALRAHVAIAHHFGPYRISLHSGSDKWSLYPVLAQEARGFWHVKTAGTSYLVALGVIAHLAPELFREIVLLSREAFGQDRATYHLSANSAHMPEPNRLPDEELPKLLEDKNVRQILHVTFGSVLKSELGKDLKRTILEYEEVYHQALASHLSRHLKALGVKDDV